MLLHGNQEAENGTIGKNARWKRQQYLSLHLSGLCFLFWYIRRKGVGFTSPEHRLNNSPNASPIAFIKRSYIDHFLQHSVKHNL